MGITNALITNLGTLPNYVSGALVSPPQDQYLGKLSTFIDTILHYTSDPMTVLIDLEGKRLYFGDADTLEITEAASFADIIDGEVGGSGNNTEAYDVPSAEEAGKRSILWSTRTKVWSHSFSGGLAGLSDAVNPKLEVRKSIVGLIDELIAAGVPKTIFFTQHDLTGISSQAGISAPHGAVWVSNEAIGGGLLPIPTNWDQIDFTGSDLTGPAPVSDRQIFE